MDERLKNSTLTSLLTKPGLLDTDYLELEGIKVPVFVWDTVQSLVDRVDADDRIPYSKKIINGKPVLMRDHILQEIKIEFEIFS